MSTVSIMIYLPKISWKSSFQIEPSRYWLRNSDILTAKAASSIGLIGWVGFWWITHFQSFNMIYFLLCIVSLAIQVFPALRITLIAPFTIIAMCVQGRSILIVMTNALGWVCLADAVSETYAFQLKNGLKVLVLFYSFLTIITSFSFFLLLFHSLIFLIPPF